MRYHEDSEDRSQPTETWQQNADGSLVYQSTGAPDTRYTSAKAWSAYIADDIAFGQWIVSPGVRIEDYKIEREGSADKVADEQVTLLGLGATYQLNEQTALFAGLHEGHSPAPNDGSSDPEEALNFETGVRFNGQDYQGEATVFVSDYKNLLGKCTASGAAGDCDIGDTENGGEVTIKGLELMLNTQRDLGKGYTLPLGLTYTYTDAKFETTFSDGGDVWGNVEKGDKLPSLSDHQLQVRAGLEKEKWGLDLNVNYFSDTCATAACNVNEEIDAYTVIDLSSRYQLTNATKLYANVDNLLDSEDVVARAPKNGARAQKPLSFMLGVSHNF
jgi:Fe(3+) dicitrate transport protein